MNEESLENSRVRELEEKIIWLQGELEKERRKSMSMWESFRGAFLKEGNTDDQAVFWANEVAAIVTKWINAQRQDMIKRVEVTGSLPPYTACLNDLSISLTPPGEPVPEMYEPPVGEVPVVAPTHGQPQFSTTLSFAPQPNFGAAMAPLSARDLPLGDVINPRVNVPRPFSVMASRANVPQPDITKPQ